jgi:putative ABC transport system permease protein
LTSRYIYWAIAANILATPAAYFIMNKWLDSFAYKVSIEPRIFIITLILSLSLTFCIVGAISLKTALSNPAKILKQ